MKGKELEHLKAGMYIHGKMKSTGAEFYATVINTNPVNVMNVIHCNGGFIYESIGDADITEMTTEERRFYFDTLISMEKTPYPHYDGDEEYVDCGEVMVTDDGELACTMGTTIKVPQITSDCFTMLHINLSKEEWTKEPINNRHLYRANPKQTEKYWKILNKVLKEQQNKES